MLTSTRKVLCPQCLHSRNSIDGALTLQQTRPQGHSKSYKPIRILEHVALQHPPAGCSLPKWKALPCMGRLVVPDHRCMAPLPRSRCLPVQSQSPDQVREFVLDVVPHVPRPLLEDLGVGCQYPLSPDPVSSRSRFIPQTWLISGVIRLGPVQCSCTCFARMPSFPRLLAASLIRTLFPTRVCSPEEPL